MRLKKPILLYCGNARLLSATAYALRLHPYEVSAFCNSADVMAMFAGESNVGFACVILIHAEQGDLAGRLIHRVLSASAPMPLLLVDRAGDLAPVRYADIVLYGHNTSMAHILAALEVLCAGKQRSRHGSAT
ncbi:MAG: hypothetical protein ABI380_03465 [Edaphobacter sp.]|jgi:hypothetical protein